MCSSDLVLLTRVDEIPKDAVPVKADGRLVILAEGEATGHHHSVDAGSVALLEVGEKRYLSVKEETPLNHQEHAAITLKPGIYEVQRQTEAWRDELRQVRD